MLEYNRIDISEEMLIQQVCQKNVIFATIGILKILVLNMRSMFVIALMI